MNKFPPFYVTPTLLNAFTQGYNSLLSLLKREEIELNEGMKKGLEFEEKLLNGEIEEVREILDGALYQTLLYKPINNYIGIFGYSDFIKYDTIYDAKYVKSYEIGKYINATQHLAYCYCADIDNFSYIIGCGDEIFFEDYSRNDKKLFEIVDDFIKWLKATGYDKVFEKNYKIERQIDKIMEKFYYEN